MRILIAATLTLLLAACGFQPMYAPSSGGAAIGPVNVSQIDGRAGHVLKTELDRILGAEANAGGEPQQLDITLRESVLQLGIRRDESASRAEYRLTARYTLTGASGAPIRGSLSTVVNYEIPPSAFAEIAAQDDARDRAAETMAQRLRAELAIKLAQARSQSAGRS
jgi:LPS-assembly lipoprotein